MNPSGSQNSLARGRRAAAPAWILAALLALGHGWATAQQPGLADLTREGTALVAEGNLAEALDRFQRALELRPADPALEFNVGLVLFQMGRFDECVAPLQRATAHPPSAQQARFLLGLVHFQRDDFLNAAPALEAARPHAELGEQALYMLVEIYRKDGEVESAQEAFLELQRRFPGSAFYHKLMGAAYDAEGMHEEALQEFHAALRKDPGMPDVAAAIGFLHFKQREHGRAAEWLAKELVHQSCHAKVHFYLGEIEAAAGEVAAAERRFREAIACDGRYASGYAGLGDLLVKQGRYTDALGPLGEAVALDPDSADAQYSLGQALLRLGRDEEARAAFERVEAIHAAKHSTARRALGNPEPAP